MTATEPVYNFKIGDDVWVEDPSHCWDRATIVKLIQSVAGCYEIVTATGKYDIVHEYRLRRYVND